MGLLAVQSVWPASDTNNNRTDFISGSINSHTCDNTFSTFPSVSASHRCNGRSGVTTPQSHLAHLDGGSAVGVQVLVNPVQQPQQELLGVVLSVAFELGGVLGHSVLQGKERQH